MTETWDGKTKPGDTRIACLFVAGMSVAFWVLLGASLWMVLG